MVTHLAEEFLDLAVRSGAAWIRGRAVRQAAGGGRRHAPPVDASRERRRIEAEKMFATCP